MKKSLWVALLCMGLTLLALPAAWMRIDQGKDKIIISEEVLSGDPAAAAGTTLRIASHWEGHLLWDTEYVIGSGNEAESEFDFFARQVTWERKARKSAKMDFIYGAGFGTVMTDSAFTVNPESMPYPEIARAVSEHTKAGEIYAETVKIEDYYEYYPVEFLLEGSSVEYEGDYDGELVYLMELFRIPPGNDSMEVTVEKNAAGEPVSIKGEWVSNFENILISDAWAYGEGGCYYAFGLESRETGRPSYRGENRGIFYLPFQEADGWIRVDMMQMRKLCPLPDGTVPAAMLLEEEADRLYLTVKEETDYSLLVYGLESGMPVLEQRISLGREEVLASQRAGTPVTGVEQLDVQPADVEQVNVQPMGEQYADEETEEATIMPRLCAMTMEEGGLLMTWSDNGFAFVTGEEGQCRLWCSGKFPDSESAEAASMNWDIRRHYNLFPQERECLFDGERLVLAALNGWKSVDVLLAVYDQDGEVYSGLYRHSGETADLLYGNYQMDIVPQGRNPYDWLEEPYRNEAYVQGTGEPVKSLELSGR